MWRNILIHLCVVTYRFLFNFLVRSATNTKNPSQLRQTQPRTVNSNHSVGSGDSGKVEELKQQVNLEYNLLPHWRCCMVYRGSGNTEIFYLSCFLYKHLILANTAVFKKNYHINQFHFD